MYFFLLVSYIEGLHEIMEMLLIKFRFKNRSEFF